jgi:hypothetical protein
MAGMTFLVTPLGEQDVDGNVMPTNISLTSTTDIPLRIDTQQIGYGKNVRIDGHVIHVDIVLTEDVPTFYNKRIRPSQITIQGRKVTIVGLRAIDFADDPYREAFLG